MVGSRGRYTRHACEACKLSKRKCDGHSPCSRCDRLGEECVYTARVAKPTQAKAASTAKVPLSARRESPAAVAAARDAQVEHAVVSTAAAAQRAWQEAAVAGDEGSECCVHAHTSTADAGACEGTHAPGHSHAQRVRARAAAVEMEELLANNIALSEKVDLLQRECAALQSAVVLGVGMAESKLRRGAGRGRLGVPMLVLGEGMVVRYASSELEGVLGCSASELIGTRLECLGDDGMQRLKDSFVAQLHTTCDVHATWSTVLPQQPLTWFTPTGEALRVPTVIDIAVLRGVPRITITLARTSRRASKRAANTAAAANTLDPAAATTTTKKRKVARGKKPATDVAAPPLATEEEVRALAPVCGTDGSKCGLVVKPSTPHAPSSPSLFGALDGVGPFPFPASVGASGSGGELRMTQFTDMPGVHSVPTVMGAMLPLPDFLSGGDGKRAAAVDEAGAVVDVDGDGGVHKPPLFDPWAFPSDLSMIM